MTYPVFATGDALPATDLNAIGLWLVKSQTVGSGVSSVTVTGAFSSTYDNYKITYTGGVMSTNGSITMKLNNSSGTTYQLYGYFGNFGAGTLNGYGPAAGPLWYDAGLGATTRFAMNVELAGPFLTQQTFGTTWSSSTVGTYSFSMLDSASVSNTGFTLAPLAVGATLTGGTIRVYGYRN